MASRKVYITTPIYYSNGSPHIGHLLTTTYADILARYYRIIYGEDNVFFTTGNDEHGTTVEQSARKEGYSNLQKYVDERAKLYKKAFDDTSISYDFFVRTTNKKHISFAKNFIKKMIDAGDVYQGEYIGKYCNGCEKFLTLSDLNEEGLCPYHRQDQIVEVREKNYFFRLSKYASKIKSLIEKNELVIYPNSRKNEILARISQGVDDVSISRPKDKVSWGIEFPNDKDQTIYVWVEALINYLSSLSINKKEDFWTGVIHTMAKDINWFHNVIWPSMLLSAGYPVYKKAFVHSFINVDGKKVSKSLGNAISPTELVSKYGVDGTRYLICLSMPYNSDSDVNYNWYDEKYNSDLANGLGNLVSRVSKLSQTLGINAGNMREINSNAKNMRELLKEDVYKNIRADYEEFKLHNVVENINKLINEANIYLNEKAPWKNSDKDKAIKDVIDVIKKIMIVSNLVKPIMPNVSEKILKIFSNDSIKAASPLFNRIK